MSSPFVIIPLFLLFLSACAATTEEIIIAEQDSPHDQGGSSARDNISEWMNAPLTDIASGEPYTIASFDQAVFIESFAVWCPTCTRQQKEFKKFHESNPEIITIALNTDPNEDAGLVKEHIDSHGFDWYYSISPAELTQQLIDEFGLTIVNAPAVPVILICPGGEPQLLARGVKDQADLTKALLSCEAA